MEEIRKNLETGKLVLGLKRTLKLMRKSSLDKIFLASNCPEMIAEDIMHYSNLASVEVVKLEMPCDELGTLCRKPFPVTVASLMK